ncbi:hypothetical protein BDZ91DRAFT_796703 [Kalaharituber pfeilii]|nr:hypothetical protein BDZ91DRAFT_796703 [Kalaharituber pfeilii]
MAPFTPDLPEQPSPSPSNNGDDSTSEQSQSGETHLANGVANNYQDSREAGHQQDDISLDGPVDSRHSSNLDLMRAFLDLTVHTAMHGTQQDSTASPHPSLTLELLPEGSRTRSRAMTTSSMVVHVGLEPRDASEQLELAVQEGEQGAGGQVEEGRRDNIRRRRRRRRRSLRTGNRFTWMNTLRVQLNTCYCITLS